MDKNLSSWLTFIIPFSHYQSIKGVEVSSMNEAAVGELSRVETNWLGQCGGDETGCFVI